MSETEITKAKATPLDRPAEVINMHRLLEQAVALGKDGVNVLECLSALDERRGKVAAARAFALAKVAFQGGCPQVFKKRGVGKEIDARSGSSFKVVWADLEDIMEVVREPLLEHGLSYRWRDRTFRDDKGVEYVEKTCILSHIEGHTEESSATMPVNMKFGGSPEHKYISAGTYARRQSLIDNLGLVLCDEVNPAGAPPDFITPGQAAEIAELITKSGRPEANVIDWQRVSAIEEIHLSKFGVVVAKLHEAIKLKEETDGDK